MIELLQGACVVIGLVCVAAIIYSIWKAIQTSKRNREEEAIAKQIFLAQMTQSKNKNDDINATPNIYGTTQPLVSTPPTNEPKKTKELNYEEFENVVDVSKPSNKGLKDFFAAN